MLLSSLLFAVMNLFARVASSAAPWASVAATRALVGAAVALMVARLRGTSLAVRDARGLFLRSLLGTVSMVLSFRALTSSSVSLGDTVTLFNLSPVFVALLAPVALREKTSARTALAIALAFLGAALVVRAGASSPPAVSSGPSATVTIATAIAAAFASSLAMMLLRRVGQTDAPEAVAFYFSLFAGFAMSALALPDARLPSLRTAAAMVLTGLTGGLAQIAMTRAYALESAARVGSLSYASVVATTALGAAFLGERPPATAVAGTGLVIAGGLVVTFSRPKPA